jgi:hypothetical protein
VVGAHDPLWRFLYILYRAAYALSLIAGSTNGAFSGAQAVSNTDCDLHLSFDAYSAIGCVRYYLQIRLADWLGCSGSRVRLHHCCPGIHMAYQNGACFCYRLILGGVILCYDCLL